MILGGIVWSEVTSPANANWYYVASNSSGQFLAATSSDGIYISTSGIITNQMLFDYNDDYQNTLILL